MRRNVGPLSSQWEFHTWGTCGRSEGRREFADRLVATLWLRQFRSSPTAMADLRAVAAKTGHAGLALGRSGDDRVLEAVSWLLVRGVLHVHKVSAPATTWRPVDHVLPAPVSKKVTNSQQRASPAQQSRPAPNVVEEADTFSARTDGAATADVLRSAAASGVPFCEECAKAATARQAA